MADFESPKPGHSGSRRKISVPMLLRRAGLPANLFEQEKIYVTTAEVFAIWRTVAEMSPILVLG